MKRRDLLRNGILLGTAAGVGALRFPSLAYANPSTERYFVFCYFTGGWDILLSLDPRNPEDFTDEQIPYTLIQPGYNLLPTGYKDIVPTSVPSMFLGPYMGEMERHANKMCIVRGMTCETVGHFEGYRRFLTGKETAGGNARGSSLGTNMAALYGAQEPIPNLCMRIESYNEDHAPVASGIQVGNVDDLLVLLGRPESSLSADYLARIDAFVQTHPESQTSTLLTRAIKAEKAAQELTALQLDAEFDFTAQTDEMASIRSAFQISGNNLTPSTRAAIAAKALTGGLSRVVSFAATDSSLDTHTNWVEHQGPRQLAGWNAIARLVDYLETTPYGDGSSWLDHTTIMAFSEFSRTPILNSNSGRDHHITNACMLLGAGIKKGVVLGASSDIGMGTLAMDLQTGALDSAGTVVLPEHIHRALLYDIGYTDDIFRMWVDPFLGILENS